MVTDFRLLPARYASPTLVFRISTSLPVLITKLSPLLLNRCITTSIILKHAPTLLSLSLWKLVCLNISLFFCFYLTSSFVLDDPVPPITDQDHVALKRAKNVVSDPIIIDITDESLSAAEFTQNSLRLQIIQGCQHLRSYTSSVDRLMGLYHDSIAANPPSSDNA